MNFVFKVKIMKKNLLIVLIVTLLLNTMCFSAMATTEGTLVLKAEESFDTDCENLSANASYSNWRTVSGLNAANADVVGVNGERIRVENGKLIVPGAESGLMGAEFTYSAANYAFGFNNLNSNGRQKADEYMFEFDAKFTKNESLYLHDAGTVYLKIRSKDSIYIDGPNDIYIDANDGEFHHYKIAVSTEYFDANGIKLEYLRSTGKLYDANGEIASASKMRVVADVYVDGICYAMGVPTSGDLSNPGVRQLKGFTAITESAEGRVEVDDIKVYYLDGEKRTDATFTFKDSSNKTVFSGNAEDLNASGNKIEVELRADGTQSEEQKFNVYVVLFDVNGKLKDVAIAESNIPAESTEKVAITVSAPYFEEAAFEADDYICVFVWEDLEKIPFTAERIIKGA